MIKNIVQYIQRDWQSNPGRFYLELFSWTCATGSAITFAVTAPNVPFVPLYFVYISACVSAAWCCYSRGSFGLMINAIFIATIDCYGLARLLNIV